MKENDGLSKDEPRQQRPASGAPLPVRGSAALQLSCAGLNLALAPGGCVTFRLLPLEMEATAATS